MCKAIAPYAYCTFDLQDLNPNHPNPNPNPNPHSNPNSTPNQVRLLHLLHAGGWLRQVRPPRAARRHGARARPIPRRVRWLGAGWHR